MCDWVIQFGTHHIALTVVAVSQARRHTQQRSPDVHKLLRAASSGGERESDEDCLRVISHATHTAHRHLSDLPRSHLTSHSATLHTAIPLLHIPSIQLLTPARHIQAVLTHSTLLPSWPLLPFLRLPAALSHSSAAHPSSNPPTSPPTLNTPYTHHTAAS